MNNLLFIIITSFLLGCMDATSNSSDPKALDAPDSISYLALGDSYTIGESVAISERWPVQLADSLRAKGVAIATPKIIATTGWTTDELSKGIDAENITDSYGLVSLLIGVNNQYRGYDIAVYRTEFEELLQRSIAFAGNNTDRVFVVSIPDYGVTHFGQSGDPEKIARELDAYNAIGLEISQQYGVQYFNITDVSREALHDPELVAGDRLHPSGKMYTEWVKIIFPGVSEKLKR